MLNILRNSLVIDLGLCRFFNEIKNIFWSFSAFYKIVYIVSANLLESAFLPAVNPYIVNTQK